MNAGPSAITPIEHSDVCSETQYAQPRRNDSNNSLIDVYGRWATIAANGAVDFGAEFRVTTTSFPPVFAGTLSANQTQGRYDPVYPPGGVNLHWWYPDWPDDPLVTTPIPQPGVVGIEGHVGEYNGAWSDGPYVYTAWTDSRLTATGTLYPRNHQDIRFIRITWPQ